MRPFVLIAITALAALAACNKDRQEDIGRNAGSGLTAEDIVANDVTAIDAVTADAANMAADINYTDALADLSRNGSDSNANATNAASDSAPPKRSSAPPKRSSAAPARTPGAPRESTAETATNGQ